MMRTLLLFDGLGGNNDTLVAALHELYARPENAAYFHTVFTVLDDVLKYIGNETRGAVLPTDLSLKQWLESPANFPSDALRNSIVAGICVHVCQVCHLQPTGRSADDDVVAALGHSIGLQAAVVAGMRTRRMDEFLALVASSLKLVALSLVRGHQLDEARVASPELVSRYLARDGKGRAPTPMASLTGMSRHDLSSAVSRYGEDGRRSLSVSLVNSPTVQVLSGSTADLLDFYFAHETEFARSRVSWAFLSNSIPFHSSRLAPAALRVRDDLAFIGPVPGADALKVPVYATDAPRDLRQSTDLVQEFLDQVLVRPIEWELAAGHAIGDAAIERVVDCGPGPGARRFTRECLRAGARPVRFESVQQFSRRAR
jgi:malonyl CoA-acyl carrier protein transacylase